MDGSIAVWEVLNEHYDGWQMYTAGFCEILEKACLNYHKYPTEENRIAKLTQNRAFDLEDLLEIERTSGTSYPMRRLVLPGDTALGKQIVWEWNYGKKHSPVWKPYSSEVVNFLEEKYAADNRNHFNLMQICKDLDYFINFADMVQVNIKSGKKRSIARHKLQYPYPKAENIQQLKTNTSQTSATNTPSKPVPTYNYSKSTVVPRDLQAFAKAVTDIPNEDCSICITSLLDESGFHNPEAGRFCHVVELKQCQHKFHALCVKAAFDNAADKSLMCPYCKKIYGTKKGIQPPGTMDHRILYQSLPGMGNLFQLAYQNCANLRNKSFSCPTISITYNIRSGTQGKEHPNPGQPYHAVGFPRQAFLPDNTEGRKILKLLKVAWDRKLIFTIGRSVTSGMDNCVTWNEIHHKTSMRSGSHGYPDPGYFTNVVEELKAQGVTEADI